MGGSSTGFGFNGRLFWSDDNFGNLMWMKSDGTPGVFATGFVGDALAPARGPGVIVADGGDAIIVGDGHDVWRISRLPLANGVVQERSMTLKQQMKGGWVLTCSVQYSGVNGSHNHRVRLDAVGPALPTAPLSVDVGPNDRVVVIRDGGVEVLRVLLSGKLLRIDRTAYLPSTPSPGDVYSCEGRGQDTTSGGYLRSTLMQDTTP